MRAVNLLPKDDQNKPQRKQNVPVLVSTALIVLVTGLIGVMYLSSKSTAQSKEFALEDATGRARAAAVGRGHQREGRAEAHAQDRARRARHRALRRTDAPRRVGPDPA